MMYTKCDLSYLVVMSNLTDIVDGLPFTQYALFPHLLPTIRHIHSFHSQIFSGTYVATCFLCRTSTLMCF